MDTAPAIVESMQSTRPWEKDVRYFSHCRLSVVAATKMLQHAMEGVRRGQLSENGKPVEIMGLLLGTMAENTIVVTDCFALPVEGTETRVMADDESVNEYMAELSERIEQTRQERLIGWYHSHPFDVSRDSNAFLSGIDLQTQLSWQMQFPQWLAIVVDPLRSMARNKPDFGVFRAYPASHTSSEYECPDGKIVADARARQERWGMSYHRYYCLHTRLYSGNQGKRAIRDMTDDVVWKRVLAAKPDAEDRERLQLRLYQAVEYTKSFDVQQPGEKSEIQSVIDLAVDHLVQTRIQETKHSLFSASQGGRISQNKNAGI